MVLGKKGFLFSGVLVALLTGYRLLSFLEVQNENRVIAVCSKVGFEGRIRGRGETPVEALRYVNGEESSRKETTVEGFSLREGMFVTSFKDGSEISPKLRPEVRALTGR